MGVQHFFKFLKKYPNCFVKKPQTQHVLVDLNSLLHRASYKQKRSNIIKRVYRALDQLEQKSIFIAVDGSSPVAKLQTQRKRRLKSKSAHFDARELTPGTRLMRQLQEDLEYYACYRAVKMRAKVVIDGPGRPGEGEAKIIQHLYDLHEPCLIVSDDSDLVCQLVATNKPNLTVYLSQQDAYFSIDQFRQSLVDKNRDPLRTAIDFCCLMGFLGNDYLPKTRFASCDTLWHRYKSAAKKMPDRYLVDGEQLDLHVLESVFHGYRSYGPTKVESDESEYESEYESASEPEYEVDDNVFMPMVKEVPSHVKRPPEQHKTFYYLKCVLWILKLNLTGVCPDYYFTYPFQTAPDPGEIIAFCKDRTSAVLPYEKVLEHLQMPLNVPISDALPLPGPVTAAMVLFFIIGVTRRVQMDA
ncbi:hypothetical protein EDD86DRAFT_110651 [Gorgonomyces haynaldii]|nr:hypothetical protein EDD86DRAFT_110651 [Gorgonomyces haynaldii]